MNWIVHLKHLPTMLKEFDSTTVFKEKILIQYFYNRLRYFLKAQLDERGQKLDTWEETIKKAINAKIKAICQPQSLMRKMDNCCLQENRLAKTKKPTKKSKDFNKNKSSY